MRFDELGGTSRALLMGTLLSLSAVMARPSLAAEPQPADADDACAGEARNSEALDHEFSLAAEAGTPDVGGKLRFKLLAQNRLLRCRLDSHSEFLRETARLVEASAENFRTVLRKVRWLTRLRDELEASSQRITPAADHATYDAELLLNELVRSRIERVERDRELAILRSQLAAREAALTQAMVEVKRALAYQAQIKELQKKLASGRPRPAAPRPGEPVAEPPRR